LNGYPHNQAFNNNLKFSGGLLFAFFLFLALPSSAQEKQNFPNNEPDQNQEEINQPLDSHPNLAKEKETLRDSIIVKPAPAVRPKHTDGAAPKNKPEEETLSFNFLYYIIQKFKVSDIIDN